MSLYPVFARPRNLSQVQELLESLASGVSLIAGGQELMPHVNYGVLQPDVFVDLNALPELRGISEEGGVIAIGAATVHREVQTDPLVRTKLPLLAAAAGRVGGGRQVHNRGTIGGNIVSFHPLYDILPPLLALEAEVEIARGGAIRRIALAEAIRDTQAGLGSEAILVRVLVRPPAPGSGWAYEKLKNTGGAYGSANAAALVSQVDGRLEAVRLIIGAVSEKLIDATPVLADFVGEAITPALQKQVSVRCSALVTEPLDDQQGPAEWRRAMAGVVAGRAFSAAFERAAGN